MGKGTHRALQVPSVVHRERLLNRLQGVVTPGIVVVSAQAAQGKSTLVADYLERTRARACWIPLGPDDADAECFFRRVRKACDPPGPSPTQSGATPSRDDAGRPFPERLADLLGGLPADLHLVFDNWHQLGSTPEIDRRLEILFEACPSEGRLYVLSRHGIAVNLQRRRIRQQALLLTGDELAFTEDEIKAFLATAAGLQVTERHCREIQAATDGWVGALVLLVEALHHRQDGSLNLLRSPSLAARLHAETADFFQEEIYARQSTAMKHFLVVAALLDTVDGDLMREQLGRRQADQLYTEAVRRSLFVQVLAPEGNAWRFRLNPLFRTFLRVKGRARLSKETSSAFLRKAGRRNEAAGDTPCAVSYYLEAGATQAAAVAVTKIGLQLAMSGRFDEISAWTAMLPPDLFKDDPWLALLKTLTFRIQGGQRTIRELAEARAAFERSGHLRETMLALAYLIETAVFSGYDPVLRRQWIAEAEALLKQASQKPHFSYAKALLWLQVGFGATTAKATDLQKGLSACQNAVILGKGIDAPRLVSNALTIAAHAHVQAGEFAQARESLQAAEAYAELGCFPEYGALRDLTRIHLELAAGHLTPAADLLKRLAADIDAFGLIVLYPAYLEATGMLQIYRQAHGALEKTRQHMHDVAILLNNPVYSVRAAWLAALAGYHQGRYEQARTTLRTAGEAPDLPALDQARNRELLGFIDLHRGQLQNAANHFKSAGSYFDRAGMPLAACEAQLGLALVRHARQEEAAAREGLEAAFHRMAAEGYDHFPMLRPADLAQACVLGVELTIPSSDYARRLLATRLADIPPRAPTAAPPSSPSSASLATGEAGRTLYPARLPVLVIRTFGGLDVLRSGRQPIVTGSWQGSRPALLLKAILVHGSRHIPKDMLIEALWPDQPPEKSLRNFKVTLHRLRKRLEPDMASAAGSAYIHLKDNLLSLDAHLCQVDTAAFHDLCKRVRRTEPGANRDTLLAMRREAESIYQGDFLPEEPYLAWAEMKRSTLREEFLQLMDRLGQLFSDQQAFQEARHCYRCILRIDPAREKAQQRLMRLLREAGRSGEAVRLYQDFKRYLETEIGAAPDEATIRLYRSIRNQLKHDAGHQS